MRLMIIFIVISSCAYKTNDKVEISEIFNNNINSFNEFKKIIINYAKQSEFPDINE